MKEICLNGKIINGDKPALDIANRGFRYGDALFETMKIAKGKILFAHYHFERLFTGLSLMKIHIPKLFTIEKLSSAILQLCRRNKCEGLARVRLTVFRSDGSLYESQNSLQYLIESWPLNDSIDQLNKKGLIIDVFPDARKSCDKFSNLKSANYLPYVMAAIYAKEKRLNDCLVLNIHDRICDASIANVFWIKKDMICTPPLSEGCVAGVIRKYLIEELINNDFKVQEKICTINDLETANEIFLTNAIQGIRWIKQFGDKRYTNRKVKEVNNLLIKKISSFL